MIRTKTKEQDGYTQTLEVYGCAHKAKCLYKYNAEKDAEKNKDIKENEKFRRFNYRSTEKVYKEFMLYAIGRNINKYHRFLHDKIHKFEGETGETAA